MTSSSEDIISIHNPLRIARALLTGRPVTVYYLFDGYSTLQIRVTHVKRKPEVVKQDSLYISCVTQPGFFGMKIPTGIFPNLEAHRLEYQHQVIMYLLEHAGRLKVFA